MCVLSLVQMLFRAPGQVYTAVTNSELLEFFRKFASSEDPALRKDLPPSIMKAIDGAIKAEDKARPPPLE